MVSMSSRTTRTTWRDPVCKTQQTTTTGQKQLGWKKGFIVVREVKPCQELELDTWMQELELKTKRNAAYWLTSGPLSASHLSYTVQAHLPGVGLPTSISKQENTPQTCPQASLVEATRVRN